MEIEDPQCSSIEINEDKALVMLRKIIKLEATNIRTKKYNEYEMAQHIKKIIEEEVECY